MLDYRALVLNCYREPFFERAEPDRKNFLTVYNKIDNPIVYTAFLLFFINDAGNMHFRDAICKSIGNVVQLSTDITRREQRDLWYLREIARYIKDSVRELGVITYDDFIEGWTLLDIYNWAGRLIDHYNNRSMPALWSSAPQRPAVQVPVYQKLPWLCLAIDFCRRFDREQYPQVNGWWDWVLYLPQILGNCSRRKITFSDYVAGVRDGLFNGWYRRYKCSCSYASFDEFQSTYLEQLSRLEWPVLEREYRKNNWGRRFVKEEMARREEVCQIN